MKQKHRKKPSQYINIAKQRINELFSLAKSMYDNDSKLSNEYLQLARKIAMKYKVKLTSPQKRKFCNHCYAYLVPGNNCTVRLHKSRIIYYCRNCKKYTRIPVK